MAENILPIDFGGGVDTKTDPKLVIPSKFQVLYNGIFTKIKRIGKRPGYDNMTNAIVGGGTWSDPTMVQEYKDELVLAATSSVTGGQRLFSWSETLGAWQDKGKYVCTKVSKTEISANTVGGTLTSGPANCTSAIAGNIALFCYDTGYGVDDLTGLYTVVDLQTGTQLVTDAQINTSAGWQKAALLGTNQLAIFYINQSSEICFRLVTVSSSGGVVLGSEMLQEPCGTGITAFPFCYDFVTTSTGCVLSVANEGSNQINTYPITSSGSVGSVKNITTQGNISPISLNQDSSGNIWLYFGDVVSSVNELRYAVYSSTLTVVLGSTEIGTITAQQVVGFSTSSTTQTVYYSVYTYPTSQIGVIYSQINSVTVNTSGTVGTPSVFTYGADIYSKPVALNATTYLACMTLSSTIPTGLLVDLADGLPVAKFLPGLAEGIYQNTVTTAGSTDETASPIAIRMPGFLASIYQINSTQLVLSAGFVVSLDTVAAQALSNNASVTQAETQAAIMGFCYLIFDFDNIDAYQSLIQQDTLILNGAIVSQYDSSRVTELGFTTDPDGVAINTATSGGHFSTGLFTLYVIYQWVDALGNLHQSAPSLGALVYFETGSANRINVTVQSIIFTQKQNVQVSLYCTESDGSIAYLVGSVSSLDALSVTFSNIPAPNATPSTVSIINAAYDLYTQGGAILENIAPPPSMILWTNENRIWCIDSENEETTIEYSKTASAGTGISFSTGQLELVVDSKYGAMTGAAPMDEKTVIFKESGVGYFIGDGANDAGSGSTITSFQFVPSDVGCSNSKSVISYPRGILFRTNKGIYQLSRGLEIEYFGTDVQGFNSQDIQDAQIVQNRNQIRFLTSSGYSLLYDYVMNQWSAFTNHTGYSGTIWNGLYVYARTDGSVYIEDITSELDNTTPFNLALQTGWIALSSVQGFERVRWIMMLGDYQNGANAGHGLSIQAAYNFSPTFDPPVNYYFGAASGSGVFQYRNFFRQQKCGTISLLISEITTGASGEYLDLTNMSFVAALKQGTNKLPYTGSVG